jgi:nitroreductase
MNETIKNILTRRSNRSYLEKPVEKEKLDLIIKCGIYSPTARGVQPWHFTVVTNRSMLDKISAINKKELYSKNNQSAKMSGLTEDYDNFRGAPVAIIISGMSNEKYGEAACANAATNMAVAAHSLRLGSCYIASFRPAFSTSEGENLKKEFGIPVITSAEAGFRRIKELFLNNGKLEKS